MKRDLADALILAAPGLEPFTFDYAKLADSDGIEEAEARRRWRHIELTEESLGLQITLYDDHTTVAVAYWHDGQEAEKVWRDTWKCLLLIRARTGFQCYDPQLDRELDLEAESDFQEVLQRYVKVKRTAEQAIRTETARKPWWKVW